MIRVSHGPRPVLLPGDVEDKAWNDMIDSGLDLSADVLVASHHGRRSGYSEEAMGAISPERRDHFHRQVGPAHDAEARLPAQWTKNVYSTRTRGTIWVRMYDSGAFDLFDHDERDHRFRPAARRVVHVDLQSRRASSYGPH